MATARTRRDRIVFMIFGIKFDLQLGSVAVRQKGTRQAAADRVGLCLRGESFGFPGVRMGWRFRFSSRESERQMNWQATSSERAIHLLQRAGFHISKAHSKR